MTTYVLTVTCPSTRGIVAAISGFLADKGCNITDSAQFDDAETGRFFTRTTFVSTSPSTISGVASAAALAYSPSRIFT